jgi:hypothetical protein
LRKCSSAVHDHHREAIAEPCAVLHTAGGVREARQRELRPVDAPRTQPGYEDAPAAERDFPGDLPVPIGAAVRTSDTMRPFDARVECRHSHFVQALSAMNHGGGLPLAFDHVPRFVISPGVPDVENPQ